MMHVILYFAAVDFLVHKLWLKLAVNCLYRKLVMSLSNRNPTHTNECRPGQKWSTL